MSEKRIVAVWESRGKATTVTLYADECGYTYKASGAGGSIAATSDPQAIGNLEGRINDFQPDANKTPMRRVY